MKIKITYEKGERISAVMMALEKLFPDGKWKFSDRHKPFFHAYFNISRCNNDFNNK